jgi:predicted permease
MSWLWGDLKYAFRGMAKRPGFTAAAVLSLALGIGANTTIFSLLNGILLRPLAVANPETLAAVYCTDPRSSGTLPLSYPNYKDLRDRNTVFSSLALYTPAIVSLGSGGESRPLMAHIVSGNYFQTLGVAPVIGRGFLPEEDVTPNARAVAVISYGLWGRLFAFDRGVTSRTMTVSGREFSIVGVAPADFRGINELYGAELWVPMAMYPTVYYAPALVNQRRASFFSVIGRLKPGITLAQANGAMQSLGAELAREYPRENNGRGVEAAPAVEAVLNQKDRAKYSQTGLSLLIMSGIVLLIACGNVASLLLSRAAGRAKEITVRLAIGASRWQLIRQLLVESIALSAVGGVLGLALAPAARAALWPLRPPALRYAAFRFDLDARVLGYAFAIALLTGIIFGLPPAFSASRSDLASDLKERTGAASMPTSKFPPRAVLVMLQLAFSLVALLGAGLFLRSMQAAMKIDPGFDAAHLGAISFNVADQGYGEARGREYRQRILERASAVPGVQAASLAKDLPFTLGGSRTVLLQGQDNALSGQGRMTLTSVTYPGYFDALRIPVLSGRDFSLADSPQSPRVAIVNETAARHFWPGEQAVGKVVEFAGENLPVQIVGVVRTAAYRMPGEEPQAMIYLSAQQYYFPYAVLYIRAARDTAGTLSAVQREIHSVDPNLYLDPETAETAMRKTLWEQSLSATLLSAFGGMALLLSAIGIYGVMSFGIRLRVREIGVRMALGAQEGHVQRMLVREGARLIVIGAGLGVAAAFMMSRMLESMLIGVSARDLTAFVAAPCILAAVALVACWIPAYRATRIDPAAALRTE